LGINDRWYQVRVTLRSETGTAAQDEVDIHGARALSTELALRLLASEEESVENTQHYLGPCRRFTSHRIDCEKRVLEDRHGHGPNRDRRA
jgi:hypothetical protein